jgi:hypothetical protein
MQADMIIPHSDTPQFAAYFRKANGSYRPGLPPGAVVL